MTCDDLLEIADKQIDLIKTSDQKGAIKADAEGAKRLQVENTLKKPQHAWIRQIDNSFNVFVPLLTKKEHYFCQAEGRIKRAGDSEGQLCPEISEAQNHKRDHPTEYGRLVTLGDHKRQKEQDNLPHPYSEELNFFDNEMVADHANITNIPDSAQVVDTLEATPFTFVETQEQLEALAKKLEVCKEIAIDLEHHQMRSFQGITCLI